MTTTTPTIYLIDVDQIDPHPDNRRHELGNLAELTRSIRAQGIRQNLLLVAQPTADAADEPRYTVVIGHRRLAAAKKAGLKVVPAEVDELTDAEQLELMLVENVQRDDLTVIEEAEGYQALLDLGMTTAAIAKRTGRPEKTVQARVKTLALPDAAKAKMQAGQARLEDAVKLEQFGDDAELQAQLAGKLGTANFTMAVVEAIRSRELDAERAEMTAALAARGITKLTPGHRGRYIGAASSAEQLTAFKDIPEGSVFDPSTSSVTVWIYAPAPPAPTAESTARAAAEQAARQAVADADRAARAKAVADGQAASKVRGDWIAELISGRSSTQQRAMIAQAAVPALAANAFTQSHWATYFGLKGDARWSSTKITQARDPWLEKTEWAWVLLTQLHLIVDDEWDGPCRVLYDLLAKLGYQPSDLEREYVYGTEEAGEDA